MSNFPINRYDEQRLIQEVHYLHSLWHQGPPHPNVHPQTPVSLQPSGSTQFKKRNKQKSKKLKEAIIDSGVEWVFPTPAESSPVTESGWPSFTAQPNSQPHLPTAEELARVAGNRAQQQALKVVSEYLKYSIDDEEEDMYEDEDEDDMEVEKGEKNLNFFAKLFEEDNGLREYYEKNSESGGEFICLVCSGVGKKGWSKRFKDCVGLVQHSITISNKRQAHRAFGQVICRILGWDINRLPSIVLSAGGKPSESSDKSVEAQGNEDAGGKDCLSGLSNTTDAVNIGTDELSQQKQSFSNENQQENGGGSTALEGNEGDGGKNSLNGQSNTRDTVNISSSELSQQNRSSGNKIQPENGDFSITLESTSEANANEDVSSGIPETAKENAEGASNCLEPLQMI
uniref:Putative ovule protein n=1 Tax=Solanum chacoense TaxID=4108 RepID=A0A0V0I8B7_SOLCH